MKIKLLFMAAGVSIVSIALMAFAPLGAVQASTDDGRRGPYGTPSTGDDTLTGQSCTADCTQNYAQGSMSKGTGYAQTPLSDVEAAGLISAIEEEYAARALYEGVLEKFGSVIPFSEIAVSEANHASALIRQAEKYGLEVPVYEGADAASFASLEEACQAGVDAEIADAALYDELMSATTRTDLIRAYSNLQTASLNNHLVQFEACN
jgi:hypothetical protein